MDKWATIHKYRRAVTHGNALPIRCPDCNDELVPVVGRKDEPVLKCFYCRTTFDLGADIWKQIKAIADDSIITVTEYFQGNQ